MNAVEKQSSQHISSNKHLMANRCFDIMTRERQCEALRQRRAQHREKYTLSSPANTPSIFSSDETNEDDSHFRQDHKQDNHEPSLFYPRQPDINIHPRVFSSSSSISSSSSGSSSPSTLSVLSASTRPQFSSIQKKLQRQADSNANANSTHSISKHGPIKAYLHGSTKTKQITNTPSNSLDVTTPSSSDCRLELFMDRYEHKKHRTFEGIVSRNKNTIPSNSAGNKKRTPSYLLPLFLPSSSTKKKKTNKYDDAGYNYNLPCTKLSKFSNNYVLSMRSNLKNKKTHKVTEQFQARKTSDRNVALLDTESDNDHCTTCDSTQHTLEPQMRVNTNPCANTKNITSRSTRGEMGIIPRDDGCPRYGLPVIESMSQKAVNKTQFFTTRKESKTKQKNYKKKLLQKKRKIFNTSSFSSSSTTSDNETKYDTLNNIFLRKSLTKSTKTTTSTTGLPYRNEVETKPRARALPSPKKTKNISCHRFHFNDQYLIDKEDKVLDESYSASSSQAFDEVPYDIFANAATITSDMMSRSFHDADEDELEIPYAQNFDETQARLISTLSNDKKEPLRPGDIIVYDHPMYICGTKEALRITQVLKSDNTPGLDFPLELANGDYLSADTQIRRVREYKKGNLYPHSGLRRPIEMFCFTKATLSNDYIASTFHPGLQRQVQKIQKLLDSAKHDIAENSATLRRSADHTLDNIQSDDLGSTICDSLEKKTLEKHDLFTKPFQASFTKIKLANNNIEIKTISSGNEDNLCSFYKPDVESTSQICSQEVSSLEASPPTKVIVKRTKSTHFQYKKSPSLLLLARADTIEKSNVSLNSPSNDNDVTATTYNADETPLTLQQVDNTDNSHNHLNDYCVSTGSSLDANCGTLIDDSANPRKMNTFKFLSKVSVSTLTEQNENHFPLFDDKIELRQQIIANDIFYTKCPPFNKVIFGAICSIRRTDNKHHDVQHTSPCSEGMSSNSSSRPSTCNNRQKKKTRELDKQMKSRNDVLYGFRKNSDRFISNPNFAPLRSSTVHDQSLKYLSHTRSNPSDADFTKTKTQINSNKSLSLSKQNTSFVACPRFKICGLNDKFSNMVDNSQVEVNSIHEQPINDNIITLDERKVSGKILTQAIQSVDCDLSVNQYIVNKDAKHRQSRSSDESDSNQSLADTFDELAVAVNKTNNSICNTSSEVCISSSSMNSGDSHTSAAHMVNPTSNRKQKGHSNTYTKRKKDKSHSNKIKYKKNPRACCNGSRSNKNFSTKTMQPQGNKNYMTRGQTSLRSTQQGNLSRSSLFRLTSLDKTDYCGSYRDFGQSESSTETEDLDYNQYHRHKTTQKRNNRESRTEKSQKKCPLHIESYTTTDFLLSNANQRLKSYSEYSNANNDISRSYTTGKSKPFISTSSNTETFKSQKVNLSARVGYQPLPLETVTTSTTRKKGFHLK